MPRELAGTKCLKHAVLSFSAGLVFFMLLLGTVDATAEINGWTPTTSLDSSACKEAARPPASADSCHGRWGGLAAVLMDGKVLVAGDGKSAQVFDPAKAAWRPTASLHEEHSSNFSAMVLLEGPGCADKCGKVLVAGGKDASVAEIFDPSANNGVGSWSLTGPLVAANLVGGPTATLIRGRGCDSRCGQVLVVGGQDVAFGQLYDPVSGTWSTTSPMVQPRTSHTATRLSNGRILLTGGYSVKALVPNPQDPSQYDRSTRTSETYDPSKDQWRPAGSLKDGRKGHIAEAIEGPGCGRNCGKVLVAGGNDNYDAFFRSAEIYDPQTGVWQQASSMGKDRTWATSAALPNGKILVAGGRRDTGVPEGASAELFDAGSERWAETGKMNATRQQHLGVLLPTGPGDLCGPNCGKYLAAGGSTIGQAEKVYATAELYTPEPAPRKRGTSSAGSQTGSSASPSGDSQNAPVREILFWTALVVGMIAFLILTAALVNSRKR